MKKISTALAAAGLLALGACGGSEQAAQNAGTENIVVEADDLTATDNLGATEGLGNSGNALDAGAGNGTDANLTADVNAADASATNSTGNSQ